MKLAPLMIASTIAFAGAALAQEQQATTLQAQGNVMVSTGGEFASAASGTQLLPGNRIMLTEGASATVVYPGACQVQFNQPGVYTVAPVCTPVAPSVAGTISNQTMTAAVAASFVIGFVALDSLVGDDNEALDAVVSPPVSR